MIKKWQKIRIRTYHKCGAPHHQISDRAVQSAEAADPLKRSQDYGTPVARSNGVRLYYCQNVTGSRLKIEVNPVIFADFPAFIVIQLLNHR